MLGGSITVDSNPGEGSTFTLRIDAGRMDDVKMLAELVRNDHHPKQIMMEPRAASLRGRVLLVVDDGTTNRELVRVVAEEAGATVREASNGREGVEAAVSEEVDAVLMDIQMPVMDGLTAATVLRGRGFTRPIIALTAHAMSGDRARCFEAGCSGYLAKPIDPDDLLAELAKHLSADREQTVTSADAAENRPDAEDQPITCSLPTEKPAFLNIAKRFVNDLVARVETMQYEYESNDWKSLGDSAHWLKGSGGTAGFHCFTEPATALHRATAEVDLPAIESRFGEIGSLVDRLPDEFWSGKGASRNDLCRCISEGIATSGVSFRGLPEMLPPTVEPRALVLGSFPPSEAKIVIIDDQPTNVDVLAEYLKLRGVPTSHRLERLLECLEFDRRDPSRRRRARREYAAGRRPCGAQGCADQS